MPTLDFIECTVTLTSSTQAKLELSGDRTYNGTPSLTAETLATLDAQRADLEAYGTTLFNALFTGDLLAGYQNALDEAEGKTLRLRFEIPENAENVTLLSQINWELLCDPNAARGGRFLASSAKIVFSRQKKFAGVRPAINLNAHINLLVVLSCPNNLDDTYAELDRNSLEIAFTQMLAPLNGRLNVEFLLKATRLTIREAVVSGKFQAIQFYGHGHIDGTTGATELLLEKDDGTADFINENTFLTLFAGPRLALISIMACHSGAQPVNDDPFSGIALGLVRQNHQAVVAMKRAIKVDTANAFLANFYKNLGVFDGVVDAAVGEAWLQLLIQGDADWSIPTLYMRLSDGRLWTRVQQPRAIEGALGNPLFSEQVLEYFTRGKVLPVIGPGILRGILPSAADISSFLATYGCPPDLQPLRGNDLPRIARFVGVQKRALYFPHGKLIDFLKTKLINRHLMDPPEWNGRTLSEVIGNLPAAYFGPDEPHVILAGLNLKTYLTTNWDSFMCEALRKGGKEPLRMRCKWKIKDKQDYQASLPANTLVYHLYGFDEEPSSMVLTEDDYLEFVRNMSMDRNQTITITGSETVLPRVPTYLQEQLSRSMLLFLGFNLRDLDFRVLFRGLIERFESGGEIDPKRVAVVQIEPGASQEELRQFIRNDASKMDIEVFEGSVGDFLVSLRNELTEYRNARV